jgi:hypothetical protein
LADAAAAEEACAIADANAVALINEAEAEAEVEAEAEAGGKREEELLQRLLEEELQARVEQDAADEAAVEGYE